MTECPTCGEDPCVNPSFCAGGRKADAKRPHSKTWRDGLITAADLQTKQFKPVRIILPGLFPEGVTILAGKPKVGKSWFVLDVSLAVADENRFVLGDTRPVHGNALYLALEDNERRLHWRIKKIIQNEKGWPKPLAIHTEWKRMDQGGLEDIEGWIKSVENPRLISIDTLAKIRPAGLSREQAYAADYRAIEGLQKLAGQYQVGIVVNHHLRKAPSEDDPLDEVSGTLGLTGSADTVVVMKRHSGMVKIYVRGRDIEEGEYAAEFNKDTCRWRLVGEADEVFRSEQRQAIATALKEANRPMSVADIMAATERRDRNATEVLLHRMEKNGEVKHVGRGLWAHPDFGGSPSEPSKNGKKVRNDNQPIGSNGKNEECESYSNLTDKNTSKIASTIHSFDKPLMDNGKSTESYFLTNLTGPERVAGGNGYVVQPRAVSNSPEDRQEPDPGRSSPRSR
jgi:hypothetical protein